MQKLENKSLRENIDIDGFKAKNLNTQAIIDVESVYRCTQNGERVKAEWEAFSVR